jgi:chromosomal replication initiation ATPase DnaA
MMTEAQIEEELKALESRKAKLLRLIALTEEVALLEYGHAACIVPNQAMQMIGALVCAKFGLGLDVLRSRNRRQEVCIPRQLVFYLARETTGITLSTIGKFFGKDHGTVIHGHHSTRDRMETDAKFAQIVAELRKQCAESLNGAG